MATRRSMLLAGAALGALGAGLSRAGAAGKADRATAIAQPPEATPEAFMKRAYEMRHGAEAAGDQSYGAVVVIDGAIIGQAPSRVVTSNDPTAHAEMEAIRDAARRRGRSGLYGAVMYSTSQPCPMCEAAAFWANIEKLVYTADLRGNVPPRLVRC